VRYKNSFETFLMSCTSLTLNLPSFTTDVGELLVEIEGETGTAYQASDEAPFALQIHFETHRHVDNHGFLLVAKPTYTLSGPQ
jgi:hypothetical protein